MNNVTPDLLTVAQAIEILDAAPVVSRVKRVRLQHAHGLRIARDVVADRDYPPFDKSLMDGFAVRHTDVAIAPVDLDIVGEIAAGQRYSGQVQKRQAVAIMTGAPVPEGADTVVPIEDCQVRQNRVRIQVAISVGKNITSRGADCAAGKVVLEHGTKLGAAQLAVAASVGAAEIEAFDRPRVAVLSTGDELVEIDQLPGPAQIRNSNNIMLVALLNRLNCDAHDMGFVRDDPALIRQAIQRGLEFDAFFVSGGMSMGQYDFVPKILKELGIELKIMKLRIKPGKPFVFGQIGSCSIFGLPGNPVSSFVCTLRLCSRILTRMGGARMLENRSSGILTTALEPNGTREFYQPAIIEAGAVTPLKWKGSADIYTLAQANALIVRPESAPAVSQGEVVRLLEIPT